MRLDRGPIRTSADATRPGFVLRDEAAESGIRFVHRRPSFDPKIAGVEPHVAALGAGVSVTDVDGDEWPDLYFTNSRFGEPNALYRNKGDGTFENVAAAAGLADLNRPGEGVSMGAVWGDVDNDGREDVLVYRYGFLSLFRNVDGKRFEDVTDRMGVGSTRWTLAAASADFDGDGWPDIYLANDYGPEELYRNEQGKRFVLTTAGLEAESKSGMSVTLGDAFNRGRIDAFVTNISERGYIFQNNNLRLNELHTSRRFRNVAEGAIADAGWAWGAQFGDLNNDGSNELFVTNGFISADRKQNYWYAMSKIAGANARFFEDAAAWPAFGNASLSGYERSRVYLNRGVAGWVDVAERVGVNDLFDGRAVALADLSNRGAVDVVVANQNQPAVLYRNRPDSANHWIAFRLVGTRSNRSAIGTEVTIESGDFIQRRVVDGGSGFASQNDRRPHFGLGKREWVDRVVIQWPSGTRQILSRPQVDGFVTVTEPGR